jgi:hypothetical protein
MYKYEVEYYHKMTILEGGSGLRPRRMKCSNCGLYVEIYDGHIKYFDGGDAVNRGKLIDRCKHVRTSPTVTSCMGWPEVPKCDWGGAKQW